MGRLGQSIHLGATTPPPCPNVATCLDEKKLGNTGLSWSFVGENNTSGVVPQRGNWKDGSISLTRVCVSVCCRSGTNDDVRAAVKIAPTPSAPVRAAPLAKPRLVPLFIRRAFPAIGAITNAAVRPSVDRIYTPSWAFSSVAVAAALRRRRRYAYVIRIEFRFTDLWLAGRAKRLRSSVCEVRQLRLSVLIRLQTGALKAAPATQNASRKSSGEWRSYGGGRLNLPFCFKVK